MDSENSTASGMVVTDSLSGSPSNNPSWSMESVPPSMLGQVPPFQDRAWLHPRHHSSQQLFKARSLLFSELWRFRWASSQSPSLAISCWCNLESSSHSAVPARSLDFSQQMDSLGAHQPEDPFTDCSSEESFPVPCTQNLSPSEVRSTWLIQSDPCEGSQLWGSLSLLWVQLWLAAGGVVPKVHERALWSLVRSGEGDWPRKVPRVHIEPPHQQELGIFYPPIWPVAIHFSQQTAEEDRAWEICPCPTGLHGLVLSCSLVHLEAIKCGISISLW